MERKIGEVFSYAGSKYKVVEGNGCRRCDFRGSTTEPIDCVVDSIQRITGHCSASCRGDNKNVNFRKVEEK